MRNKNFILILLGIFALPFLLRAEPIGPVGPVDINKPQEIPEDESEGEDEKVEPVKTGVDVPYKPAMQTSPIKETTVKDTDFTPLNPPKKEAELEIVVPFISSKEPVFLGEADPEIL